MKHETWSIKGVNRLKISLPAYSVMWLLAEKLLALVLSFTVTLAVARHLMPELFGRLSFLVALVSLAAPLMALGLNSLISRELVVRPKDNDSIVGSALTIRLISGLLVATFGGLLAIQILPSGDALMLTMLLVASIANAALVIDFWLQSHLANRQGALLRLAVLVFFSACRIVAVALAADLAVFVYLLAAEFVALGLGYMTVYQRLTGGLLQLTASVKECRGLLADSRWLFFSGVAAVLYLKVDQVLLGFMVDDEAVGIYAVAARFSEGWYFVPAALVTSYFPQLISKRNSDNDSYAMDIQKLNDFLFVVALTIALAVSASAQWLVPWLFGEAYTECVPILLVHIWAAVLVFMRALLSKWLITEDLLRLSLLSQASGAITNSLLNLFLIPRYGALGAAYATVISYLVAGYGILFLHKQLRPMAMVVSRSLILPFRLIRSGRMLYRIDAQ